MSRRRIGPDGRGDPVGDLLVELGIFLHLTRRLERFTYPGLFDRPVETDLLIIGDGVRPVVVATERADNPGASITNTAERLATAIWELPLHDFSLVEHYPRFRYGGDLGTTLDLVSFTHHWGGVSWKHLDIEGLRRLITTGIA